MKRVPDRAGFFTTDPLHVGEALQGRVGASDDVPLESESLKSEVDTDHYPLDFPTLELEIKEQILPLR